MRVPEQMVTRRPNWRVKGLSRAWSLGTQIAAHASLSLPSSSSPPPPCLPPSLSLSSALDSACPRHLRVREGPLLRRNPQPREPDAFLCDSFALPLLSLPRLGIAVRDSSRIVRVELLRVSARPDWGQADPCSPSPAAPCYASGCQESSSVATRVPG